MDVDVVMSGPGFFVARPGKGHCGGSKARDQLIAGRPPRGVLEPYSDLP